MKLAGLILLGVTLMATPWTAVACTCCGQDDWRSVESVSPNTHDAGVVSQLQLGEGRFRTGEMEWSISSVERAGNSFVFHSEVGDFRFNARGLPEHRAVDITFITQPKYQLDDVADIYHEIVFSGALQIPDSAVKQLGGKTLDVTVVLRGVGNMCWDAETLGHWLINSSKDPAVLTGSGVMVKTSQAR
jgi:hypothetical protein